MIFDASVPDSGALVELQPVDQSLHQLLRDAIRDGKKQYVNQLLERIQLKSRGQSRPCG